MSLVRFSMVASDVSATLLTPGCGMSERTKNQLHRCVRVGLEVAFVTGRRPRAALRLARSVSLGTYVVACDGAVVMRAADGRILHRDPISPEHAGEIADCLYRHGCTVFLHTIDPDAPSVGYRLASRSPVISGYLEGLGDDAFALDDGGGGIPWCPLKINALGRPGDLRAAMRELDLAAQVLRQMAGDSEQWLQVVADGVNKATGLRALLGILNIEPGGVIAFGDGENDLPMFSLAGTAVAVANAPQRIREAADFIAPSCDHDGVARFLEILLSR